MIECLRPPLVELPNERVAAQFERYYSLLVEWNEKFNLTAITEKETVYRKHFADSLYGAEWMQGAVCDIGAGAGFPSLPLAIVGAADSFTHRVGIRWGENPPRTCRRGGQRPSA